MKALTVLAWILFGIDALLVLNLWLMKNMGDDAAGRGMATGFAMLLTPMVLALGGLLFWATRSGSRPGVLVALAILGLPLWIGIGKHGTELKQQFFRGARRRQELDYPDPRLSDIAHALRDKDPARVRALAAGSALDWNARNSEGMTILGFAVNRVVDMYRTPQDVESVRILLEAGAPPASDILGTDKVLLEWVLGGNAQEAYDLLHLLFKAGADPNITTIDAGDRRPLLFISYMDPPELRIFVEHGVNLEALDTRPDQLGWTVLMQAVNNGDWPTAQFLLETGARTDVVAADGRTTLETILADATQGYQRDAAGYDDFIQALANRRAGR